jgi:hypothetical protein
LLPTHLRAIQQNKTSSKTERHRHLANAHDFFFLAFLVLSLPKKGGRGGVGAHSAPGETRKIQLGDKIGFAPVDWLYSESLTKSTNKVSTPGINTYNVLPTASKSNVTETGKAKKYACSSQCAHGRWDINWA